VDEFVWTAVSPLGRVLSPGLRAGTPGQRPGVQLSEGRGFGLFQVMARRGQGDAVAAAAAARFGVAPPAHPGAVFAPGAVLLWSGPDQFMALTGATEPGALDRLRGDLGAGASVTEQSDGRCLLRVSGPRARETLAKLSSVDLHDSMFPVGAAAATSIDHTSVILWREDDAAGAPSYGLLTFASFAASIWHGLLEASAEFGAEVGTFDAAA
jgi:heterotetrameric sarcosine oxidase gamma subunit